MLKGLRVVFECVCALGCFFLLSGVCVCDALLEGMCVCVPNPAMTIDQC